MTDDDYVTAEPDAEDPIAKAILEARRILQAGFDEAVGTIDGRRWVVGEEYTTSNLSGNEMAICFSLDKEVNDG